MKRILAAYKDLLDIISSEAPAMVIFTFFIAIINGLLVPANIYINQHIFDSGLSVARGDMSFFNYSIYLILFTIITILPPILQELIFNYIEPRSILILRTAYKARMLKKLKTMKYEHFEIEASSEIIDKAYNRAENAVRHLWPMYIVMWFSSVITSIGIITYLLSIRWWLTLTVIIPCAIQIYISYKTNYNIYTEMEKYWKKERKYNILGRYLRMRDFSKELKAFGNSGYLIDTYKKRLNEKNKEYERYYFKNFKMILLSGNITKISYIINVIFLLILFINGQISVGLFIAMSGVILDGNLNELENISFIFKWAPFHINTYDYYDKFFKLSDELEGKKMDLPKSFDIEFKDVWFRYPSTEKDIIKGLTFKIKSGEKISIVGENGEGKSTMVKLLLGLFTPDKGEILIGGKKLEEYSLGDRTKIFGPIFQDFTKYSILLKENIGIGDIDEIENVDKIKLAATKAKVEEFVKEFEKGYDTLLGKDFDGGVDISGGQWQRVAIARAFMGDKPILLLDEPTSQLDPMAEANLYSDFADMVENKTAIFITHRLGSTLITDKIFVISDGKIAEVGTHDELMQIEGVYSNMFNAQKQWYKRDEEGVIANG